MDEPIVNYVYCDGTEQKPEREFSIPECVFAWLSLLMGYLFCRAFPAINNPFGAFLLILGAYVFAVVFVKVKSDRFQALPLTVLISGFLVSLSLVLSSNSFIHFFAFPYCVTVFFYYVYSATGNSLKKGFTDLIAVDFVKALFVMPFASFGAMFKAMFSGKGKATGKAIGKIIFGICLAAIPSLIVFSLLSYDKGFVDIFDKYFSFELDALFSHIWSLILGIPVGMLIFGLLISSSDGKCRNILTEDQCRNKYTAVKIVPSLTVAVAVLPLIFLYVIFFISQWQYYISGFTGVLPENFSYAEYAREGFFQLCIVSIINLCIILFIFAFMKRNASLSNGLLKAISLTFAVITLILISTAFAKLFMYIKSYGLTQLRVYAAWFMALLALIFIIVAIKQFVPKFKALAVSFAVTVVMFALLGLVNVDGMIAKYNIDRYLDGSLKEVDVVELERLGDAAIPEMVRLLDELEGSTSAEHIKVRNSVRYSLKLIKANSFGENADPLFSRTLHDILAEKALNELDD